APARTRSAAAVRSRRTRRCRRRWASGARAARATSRTRKRRTGAGRARRASSASEERVHGEAAVAVVVARHVGRHGDARAARLATAAVGDVDADRDIADLAELREAPARRLAPAARE